MHVRNAILVIPALLLVSALAQAQSVRIGYVDSQKIFDGMPEAQKAQEKMEKLISSWQAELDKMQKEFQEKYQDFQAKQGMMTDEAKQKAQQELVDLDRNIQKFRNEKFGQDGEAVRERQKVLKPLQEIVMKAIEKVAREEKLNFVFDKLQDASLLLYADEKFDYTFKVLDVIKRGK